MLGLKVVGILLYVTGALGLTYGAREPDVRTPAPCTVVAEATAGGVIPGWLGAGALLCGVAILLVPWRPRAAALSPREPA